MKTPLILTILILLVGGIVFIVIRTSPVTYTTEVSVLRDITSKHLAQPDASKLLMFYDLAENEWNGGLFSFTNITDVSENPTQQASIKPANKWLSNEPARKSEIQAFNTQVGQILANAQSDTVGRLHSSVYVAIARELNRLSQSTAQRRVLVIYSDLMENEPNFSFYNKSTFNELQSEPDTIQKFFEGEQTLEQLNGIEVYFIYQPADPLSDEQYAAVSELYKNMLEAKGAQVTIEANLIF